MPDKHFLKVSRSSKAGKVGDTVTDQEKLGRHEDTYRVASWMESGDRKRTATR